MAAKVVTLASAGSYIDDSLKSRKPFGQMTQAEMMNTVRLNHDQSGSSTRQHGDSASLSTNQNYNTNSTASYFK
jgi:hypothetical protein